MIIPAIHTILDCDKVFTTYRVMEDQEVFYGYNTVNNKSRYRLCNITAAIKIGSMPYPVMSAMIGCEGFIYHFYDSSWDNLDDYKKELIKKWFHHKYNNPDKDTLAQMSRLEARLINYKKL